MPGALGFEPSARPFHPAEAGRLLDAAGWRMAGEYREKAGRRLTVRVLAASTLPGEVESLLVIQSQWKSVGIEMVIEPIESGARFARLTDEARRHAADPTRIPSYQAWTAGEGIRTGEIGYITERPKCDQGERGWERYCDPAFDAGFDLSQSPVSLEERLRGYAVINEGFLEGAIRLPVFVVQSNKALSRRVRGFEPNPNDALDLRGVTVGG
jgi:peptide/nickel transport system substrate-binding protein